MAEMTKLEFHKYLLDGGQPRNLDLSGLDLSNEPVLFKKKDWSNSKLLGTDFSGSDISAGIFDDAIMVRTRLTETDASKSSFANTNMAGARGKDTNLKGGKFVGTNMEFALANPDFSDSTFKKVRFPQSARYGLTIPVTEKIDRSEGQWPDPANPHPDKPRAAAPAKEFDGVFTGPSRNF